MSGPESHIFVVAPAKAGVPLPSKNQRDSRLRGNDEMAKLKPGLSRTRVTSLRLLHFAGVSSRARALRAQL
jgi:hypothetical protein